MLEEHKALIEKITLKEDFETEANFDNHLHDKGKIWFCRRLLENETKVNRNITLSNLEVNIQEKINRVARLIKAWESFENVLAPIDPPETLPGVSRLSRKLFRLHSFYQIMVGAFAIQPELSTPTHEERLRQIVAQRLRIVERMYFDIDVKEKYDKVGAFRYPVDNHDNTIKLNTSATYYWELKDGVTWVLSQLGESNPEEAILRLFIPSGFDHRNVVYCQHAISAALLDSLIPLQNIQGFNLLNLVSPKGYIRLGLPHKQFEEETFFTNDNSDKGRFEQLDIPLDDLQVGDHVFAENSDFYNWIMPDDLWQGEHALVMERFVSGSNDALGTRDEFSEVLGGDMIIQGLGARETLKNGIKNELISSLNLGLVGVREVIANYMNLHEGWNGPENNNPILLRERRLPSESVLEIYRNLEEERRIMNSNLSIDLKKDNLKTVWFIKKNNVGPEIHYLWIKNSKLEVEFDYWAEEFSNPPQVLINDFSAEEVWGAKHVLMGEGNLVKVTRPKF